MQYSIINAFANPVRLRLLCCLSKGEKNVQELIDRCGLAQSAVSQHLSKLKEAGLVMNTRKGKYIYYRLVNKKTAILAKQIEKFVKETWEKRKLSLQ
ncbi:MAG: winged helix-turn-helix transcriptional regulator [Patescibacteria group bacterium]|nr:winged helix-turn-helix transcriptional regulator [Patescibacteria group bacterium]MDE2591182.1 winged helix-turn-helix transcriptional regulator [Patescibacteria group bacterium]